MSSHKQVGGEKRERERHGKSATNVGGMDPCAHFKWLFTLVYIAQCALSFFFARSCVLSLLGLARARERKRFIYFLVLFLSLLKIKIKITLLFIIIYFYF